MNNLNIPIYRAKKIDSDEFVEGYLINGRFIFKEWIDDVWTSFGETKSNKALVYEIDPTTLAIHFKDMIDTEGTKIFASLSKDGKGGDVIQNPNNEEETGFNTFVVIYDRWQIKGKNDKYGLFGFRLAYNNKIIGIQK